MTIFQNIQMKLAGYRFGRVTLHLICLCRDGKLRWHVRGIGRELPSSEPFARWFNLRQARPAVSTSEASAFANGVEVIHDTVFLKKSAPSAA